MPNCIFDDIQLQSGQWQHICRECGVLRITKKQRLVRGCGSKTTLEQISDSATSLVEIASQVLDTRYVAPEVAEARMSICRACPYFKSEKKKCGHCGCFLEIKTSLNTASCPIERWVAVPATEKLVEQPNQELVKELLAPEVPKQEEVLLDGQPRTASR